MNPQKRGGVELVFLRARELPIHSPLIDARGRKMVAGIQFDGVKDIQLELFRLDIEEAIQNFERLALLEKS